MGKVSVTQMPDRVIKDNRITALDFCILVRIKQLQYIGGNNKKVEFSMSKLKCMMNVADNRTINKRLDNLKDKEYIEEYEVKRGKASHVIVKDGVLEGKPFTQLYSRVIEDIEDIGVVGYRLLYYLESFINRNTVKNNFCFSSHGTIAADTGSSPSSVKAYIKKLEKRKYVKIESHFIEFQGYDNDDKKYFSKFNNHYYVLLENMLTKNKKQS